MLKNNKKEVFIVLLIIIILSFTSIICTYSISKSKSRDNSSLKFYGDRKISITNKLPLSDELGKSISESDEMKNYIEFSVKNISNNNIDYDIYITSENTNNKLNTSYIKFYLTDGNDNAVEGFDSNKLPNYKDLLSLNDKPASKLLHTGAIKANKTNKYKLRVWLSDNYVISNDLENFAAKISVRVK